MELSNSPIGIYDSGVGGLTVWLELKKLVKQDLIYYGDTAHVPYGDKAKEQILFYSHTIIRFLRERQARVIIAACNTSSALALPTLQLSSGLPLFGVIMPAVKAGIKKTINKRVGLIATVNTVNSGVYQKYLNQLAPDIQLYAQKCPKLVPLIEAGILDGPEVYTSLYKYLNPLKQQNIDTLILGCTHYPFLLEPIKQIIGSDIKIVDPAEQTAQDVYSWLTEHQLTEQANLAADQFWTSGDAYEFQKKAGSYLKQQIKVVNYHQPPEEQPERMKLLLGSLAPIWRGDDD